LNNYTYQEIIFEPLKLSKILDEELLEGYDQESVFSVYGRVDLGGLA